MHIVLAALLWVAPLFSAVAKDTVPGPIRAEIVSVYDGDTFTARLHPWLNVTVETDVRVRGIDTPELRGRCPEEVAAAEAARDALRSLLAGGTVTLRDVIREKFGRPLATVEVDGASVADLMIDAGHARPYRGGRRQSWCP